LRVDPLEFAGNGLPAQVDVMKTNKGEVGAASTSPSCLPAFPRAPLLLYNLPQRGLH